MRPLPRRLIVCVAGLLAGCSAHTRPTVAPSLPAAQAPAPLPAAAATPVQLNVDPVTELIAKADREFEAGRREQQAGRLSAARTHFDAAVDLLLDRPEGARSDQRVAAAFDRLLDQISALDILALRESDGFSESRTEPAAIDELLGVATFERPEPAETTADTVAADLQRTNHDVPIPTNDRVLSFVELFQGRLHDFMEAGLERGFRYLPMIQRVFADEGVPLDLAYVPLVESAFKTNALSRVSARGMWQFMLDTGKEHGLEQDWFIDERSDPEKATRAAAQYLKTLHDMFDGDWNLALASYNAGPGRIQRAIQRSHLSDYWSLTASTRYLPRETRDYVPMIMAAMLIGANPSLYGFDVESAEPLAYERVSVPNALDLKVIAEWIGISVDELRELNPELRRTTTPARDHDLKVPLGTAATVRTKLETADPQFARFAFHTVRRGETLASIARKYRITQSELRQANDLTARSRVRVSQTLMIPQRTANALPTTAAARPVRSSTVVRASSAAPHAAGSGPLTYRVQRGDTLFSIARQFDTTVDLLKRLNGLRTDRIATGARLTVRQ